MDPVGSERWFWSEAKVADVAAAMLVPKLDFLSCLLVACWAYQPLPQQQQCCFGCRSGSDDAGVAMLNADCGGF